MDGNKLVTLTLHLNNGDTITVKETRENLAGIKQAVDTQGTGLYSYGDQDAAGYPRTRLIPWRAITYLTVHGDV